MCCKNWGKMCVFLSLFFDRCECLKLYIVLEWIGDVFYNNDKDKVC